MKALIEIDERLYKALNSYPCVYSDYVDEMFYIIRNGTPLNGTNGEVLNAVFPNVIIVEDTEYNCISISNDFWNAEYKAESEKA